MQACWTKLPRQLTKVCLEKISLTISDAVNNLLKYLKFTSSLLNTCWGTFEFGSVFFSSATKCKISFIIIRRWSDAHSTFLLTTSCIILFSLVTISCYSNSSIGISLDATIALTIFTVKALNFACPTLKYSNSTWVSESFVRIITKAGFLSKITDNSFKPYKGIGSWSVTMRP